MAILTKISGTQISDASITAADIATNIAFTGSNIGIPSVTTANLPGVAGGTNASITATVGMLAYSTTENALMQYNGDWVIIAPAPSISSISGFLNDDNDSTLTLFGGNFTAVSAVSMFDASAGGSQVGSDATTTFVSGTTLKATFGAGSIPASGTSVYIEVGNAGTTKRFTTAIVVNADPTSLHAGATGANFNTTTHLGTYGGLGPGGPSEKDTVLLLNFDRGGGTDAETSANIGAAPFYGHRVDAVGHAKIKASPFGDGKSAMFFDGSNDKLQINDHADFNFGAGDYTMECWVSIVGNQSNGSGIIGQNNAANSERNCLFIQGTSNHIRWMAHQVGVDINTATNGMPLGLGTWHHLACVREGTTATLYVDGRSVGTDTFTGSVDVTGSGSDFFVGRRVHSSDDQFLGGYMDEVRVCKGVAVYTGNFTVPIARFSGSGQSAGAAGTNIAAVTAAQTTLLIHSNLTNGGASYATFTDSATTGTTHTIIPTGAFHSTLGSSHAENTVVVPAMPWPTSGKIFGSSGAYFDGTGDFFRIGIKDTQPANLSFAATDNFTIDFWMNSSSNQGATGNGRFYGTNNGSDWAANNSWWLAYHHDGSEGYIHLNQSSGAYGNANQRVAVGNIHNSVWHHVAVVRTAAANTSMLVYVDGNYKGTITVTNTFGANNLAVSIGSGDPNGAGSGFYTGYLDSYRISKSVRYTGTATTNWSNFPQPTLIYGSTQSRIVPTITFTGTASAGLASDEDIEFTAVENSGKPAGQKSFIDTKVALTLTNLTGGNKNKATLSGTIPATTDDGTTLSSMPMKLQVRKTLGNAAYANASRTVTFSSSTTTGGLAPAMPVSGTGIPANTTITSVDSSTTITLSANPTGGTLTGQSLIFSDLTRITHVNGSDTLNNANPMMTIATGSNSSDIFSARRYVGDLQNNRSITGFGFKPDIVWTKAYTTTNNHALFDSVRDSIYAPGDRLRTNATGAQDTQANMVKGFDRDGFITGNDNSNETNKGNIAYGWKAGGSPDGILAASGQAAFGAGSNYSGLTAGAGTIHDSATNVTRATALVQSVSQSAGLSITRFTGSTHASGCMFPHNLGGQPDMVIIKVLNSADGWYTWHKDIPLRGGEVPHLTLNTTYGVESLFSNVYYTTAPNSTIISTGSGGGSGGASGNFICYAWKAVTGLSAFGSYTGTGGALTITTGFKPRFVMVKRHNADGQHWLILDGFRNDAVRWTRQIYADDTSAEGNTTTAGTTPIATGFSFDAGTTWDTINWNGGKYIYMAFA